MTSKRTRTAPPQEGQIYTMREVTHLVFIGDQCHMRFAVTVREGRGGGFFMTSYGDDPQMPTGGREPESQDWDEAVAEGLRWLKQLAFGDPNWEEPPMLPEVAHPWPAGDFRPCIESGTHRRFQRHNRAECPVGQACPDCKGAGVNSWGAECDRCSGSGNYVKD